MAATGKAKPPSLHQIWHGQDGKRTGLLLNAAIDRWAAGMHFWLRIQHERALQSMPLTRQEGWNLRVARLNPNHDPRTRI